LVHDRAPLLELFGPRNRATGSAGLFRLAGVHDQLAPFEEGDRRCGGLLPPLSSSLTPQKPLHPTHGQEDAILSLKSRVFRLSAASPDVQAESHDSVSFVVVQCAPLSWREEADRATDLPRTRPSRRYVKSTTIGKPR